MIEPAAAATARPGTGAPAAAVLPYNPVVLRGYDVGPDRREHPGPEEIGAEIGAYVLRLQDVPLTAAEEYQRVLGLAGATARLSSDADRAVLWLAASRQQLEVVRNQLLTAPGSVLGLAEVVIAVLRAYHRREFALQCGTHRLKLGRRPLIMGIVNCTPDSFYSGSTASGDEAVARAESMIAAGADLVDIGGESTRPGSPRVSVQEELDRVVPVLRRLAGSGVPVSIDTSKAAVARAALEAGASMINDISGLAYDPELGAVAASSGVPIVLMHTRGTPDDMYGQADYVDVVSEVVAELGQAISRAVLAGVHRDAIVIDPGIGFAKRPGHSLTLLRHISSLRSLGRPILVGPSRKSFIGAVLDLPAEERLEGTAAAVSIAVQGGAHILRVHDVEAMRRAATLAAAIRYEDDSIDTT